MSRDIFTKLVLIVGIILLGLNLMQSSSSHALGSYQYKVVTHRDINTPEELEKMLNEYGKQGWELLTYVPSKAGGAIFRK